MARSHQYDNSHVKHGGHVTYAYNAKSNNYVCSGLLLYYCTYLELNSLASDQATRFQHT